jgi:hypothetical protein
MTIIIIIIKLVKLKEIPIDAHIQNKNTSYLISELMPNIYNPLSISFSIMIIDISIMIIDIIGCIKLPMKLTSCSPYCPVNQKQAKNENRLPKVSILHHLD